MSRRTLNPIRIISNLGDLVYNIFNGIRKFTKSKEFPIQMAFIFLILVVTYLVALWFVVFYFKWV
jgi:hypothetical protein